MYFSPFNRTLRISGFSLGLSLLLSFLPLVGFAQSVEDDLEFHPLTLSDLTPEDRNFVSNLAVSMAVSSAQSAEGTGDYDATISANIASILSLLSSVRVLRSGSTSSGFFRSVPYVGNGATAQTLGNILGASLFSSFNQNSLPSSSSSYLYQIQRALYGSAGVPPAAQSLLPFLYSASGFTNLLVSPSQVASEVLSAGFIDELDSFLHASDDWYGTWGMIYNTLYTLSQSFDSGPPDPYEGTALYVEEGAINDVWRDNASNASASESALQVVDPEVANRLYSLEYYLVGIRDAIEGISGGSSSSFNITNVVSYSEPGSDEISEGQFSLSPIASNLRESYSSLITNVIPPSIGAVDTNSIFRLTNIAMSAMPNMDPVKNYIQDSLDSFQYSNVGTGTEITLFRTFNHSGITIPGMALDLADPRLNVLRDRCNWLARLSYALLFLVLTILRIRSFMDYVVSGFSSIYGGELEASSSSEGFNA